MQAKRSLRRVSLIFPIALAALLFASPTGAAADYSVTWTPSVTPIYVGADTVLTFTQVDPWIPAADDGFSLVALPFPFKFYDQTFTSAWVATNGYINFLAPSSVYMNWCPISGGDSLKGAIYAFWDDLDTSSGSVRTKLMGTAPNRQFVIEWSNVTGYSWFSWSTPISFQIVLSETGTITLQYLGIDQDFYERGGSAAIGLESPDGQLAAQFSCDDSTKLGIGEFAIQFSPPPTGPAIQTVAVDIKPGGCTNPFNPGSKGVLPVAVLGTANFDVTMIDPGTLNLEGVAPLRWSYEDVGTPGQCNLGPDGRMDLTLKFDTEAIAAALGTANDGQELVLSLTGSLRTGTLQTATQQNGTPISGQDKVVIKKGK